MACFYELILLHNKIYGPCNEFLRAIIFLKYVSRSNKSSSVTSFLPLFPEVFYTKFVCIPLDKATENYPT